MGDNDWMYALGLGPGLFGSAKSKNDAQRKKYEESQRAAMQAYQAILDREASALEASYAPTGAEQGNVMRRYGVAGQVGGARQLYEELDPELAGLYRQRAMEELQNPSLRYDESVGDIMGQIERGAASGAVGRGVYGSGLHAQDYSQRALQTLVPFRLQAITNALNRGDQLAKTLELMRAQAVGEYEPVRQREVQGKQLGAQYRATGAQARYGNEAQIAGGNVNRYLGREAAMTEMMGQIPGLVATAAGAPAGVGDYGALMSAVGAPSDYSDMVSGDSEAMTELSRMRASREKNPYGVQKSTPTYRYGSYL